MRIILRLKGAGGGYSISTNKHKSADHPLRTISASVLLQKEKQRFGLHTWLGNQLNGKIELVVDGLVAEVIDERAGAVTNVKVGAVNGDVGNCDEGAHFFGHLGVEANGFGVFLDGDLGGYAVVTRCTTAYYCGDDQLGGWELLNAEEVGTLEVAFELSLGSAGEVSDGDGRHVDENRAAGEDAFFEIEAAGVSNADGASVLASYFVAFPGNEAFVGVYLSSGNSRKREKESGGKQE
jgi:hypothetical protein